MASLCETYHKLPSEILRELEGDTSELFRDALASDHFMDGWEARRESIRTKDAKAKKRIFEDHRASIALVERVMARLQDSLDLPLVRKVDISIPEGTYVCEDRENPAQTSEDEPQETTESLPT